MDFRALVPPPLGFSSVPSAVRPCPRIIPALVGLQERHLRLITLTLLLLATTLFAQTPSNGPPAPELNHFDINAADRSLDPCTDFYKFACSKWIAANPIPADQATWGTGSNLRLWNDTVLRDAMVQASQPDPKRSSVQQKIGDYWAACMDESGIESGGLQPVQPLLATINSMRNKAELASVVAKLHLAIPGAWESSDNAAFAPAFGFGPAQDLADASLVV